MQYGYKNAEFEADFESVEKDERNLCEKSYERKSNTKIEFFQFY